MKGDVPESGSPEEEQLHDELDTLVYQVIIQVVEYCNIEYDEINVPLLMQMYFLVNDKLTNDKILGDNGAGDVKSVREGDVTVQRVTLLDKVTAMGKASNLISDYYNVLNKFRRLRA